MFEEQGNNRVVGDRGTQTQFDNRVRNSELETRDEIQVSKLDETRFEEPGNIRVMGERGIQTQFENPVRN